MLQECANKISCLRILATLSRPASLAILVSSVMGRSLISERFIDGFLLVSYLKQQNKADQDIK